MTPLTIDCRPLDSLPAGLAEIRAAFRQATACRFGQHWLGRSEADFQPGTVWTGWRGDELLVFAEMNDLDIFSRATALNQKMWELGDVFEIFLRPVEQEAYAEFHVTPNNQRLQLRIPNTAVLRVAQKTGVFGSFLLPGEAIRSSTWVNPGQWSALARIPAAAVCDSPKSLPGSEWKFSFSRYDATRGRREPVISSTSPHRVADFHSQAEWGTLRFL